MTPDVLWASGMLGSASKDLSDKILIEETHSVEKSRNVHRPLSKKESHSACG